MLVRPGALLLAALAVAAPLQAEPGPSTTVSAASGALALSKLRALLLSRVPGSPLEAPKSPRYLSLEEPSARGTRLLVGWVLPGLGASDLPDLRALTDALSAALRTGVERAAVPFEASVSLDVDGEAPLVVVELSSVRLAATQSLERTLLDAVASLGGLPAVTKEGSDTERNAETAHPVVPGRVAAVARAQLGPLARAVVEVHRRDVAPVSRSSKPARHVIERGDTLSQIARTHGLDLGRLAKLNDLDVGRPIRPGAELRLSEKGPPRPKLYVVKPGDSLAKVAKQFGVSEKALLEVNRLEIRRLSKGQKLVLPR